MTCNYCTIKKNMMRSCLILLSVLVLASCSKEKSFEHRVDGPVDTTVNNASGLLVKFVVKADGASDSSVATFTYNSSKAVTNIFTTSVGMVNEQYQESEYKYYRNNEGLVTKLVREEKLKHNNTVTIHDSLVYNFYFKNGLYDYALRKVPDDPNDPIIDSIVYSYDNSKRIISVVAWRHDEVNNNQLFELQKTLYTYDNKGNLSRMSITFKDDANSNDPAQIVTLQYGDKSSALNIGNDGSLEGFTSYGFSSPNNIVLLDNPDLNEKYSYDYEFNAASKPVKAIETDMVSGTKARINYYYQ